MGFNHKNSDKFFAKMTGMLHACDEFNAEFLQESAERCMKDIKRDTPADTGNLRNRWETTRVEKVGLTFIVRINNPVEYASFVEDGHYTTAEGVDKRWVPGQWVGNKFVYDPNAKTGMLLKSKLIEGRHMSRININKLEWRMQKKYNAAFKDFCRKWGI